MARVRHLYRFVLYVLRFATYVRRMAEPAFRLAQGPAEKVSVVRFATKLVLFRGAAVIDRLLQRAIVHEDTPLTIRGIRYMVGVNSHETTVFGEVYLDHGYDKVADFSPKADWVVVDVGANIGIFAVHQALRGARVYAFEPNPDCYRRMQWTVNANNLAGRIKLFNLALATRPGVGKLVLERGFTLGGKVVLHDEAGSESRAERQATVQMTSLDAIIPTLALTRIDLLKIDTEGGEIAVLRGAAQTLGLIGRVILEYHSHDLRADAEALLRDHGFEVVRRDDQDSTAGRGILYARKGTSP